MRSQPIDAGKHEILVAHTSDVHVDHEYTARLFGGDGAGGLRLVLQAAVDAKADVLLLAGDTFDSHRLPDALLVHTASVIRAFDIPVVLLPGNHDPVIDEAVFHHPAFRNADNLHILGVTDDEAVVFPELDLEVWGRAHRHYGDMDPLAFPRRRTTSRQIAMAHGHYTPVPDRSTKLRPSWLIGDDEIAATGADYIALGHWNRHVRVGGDHVRAWYSGSPDYARSINLVRLSGDGGVDVERKPLDMPAGFSEP